MFCSNCQELMTADVVDDQAIEHCLRCGGTFFKENGVNRISFKTAQKLAEDRKYSEPASAEKYCPKDQTKMAALQAEENIPPNIILFRCPTCKGIFVLPNDLVIFKKAQAAKIDYFKLWSIPLPSIRSVAVLSFVLFVSVMSFTTFLYWQKGNVYQIQAQDMIKSLFVTTSGRYLFISFKTTTPVRSRLVFIDRTTRQSIEKKVAVEPDTFHQLTTADVNFEDDIYYQIVLIDEKGRETRTEMRRLEIGK